MASRGTCASASPNQNAPHEILLDLANVVLPIEEDDVALKATVAFNPRAPQSLLHQLANHLDPEVRHHVAANSNTSAHDLINLSRDHGLHKRSGELVLESALANPSMPPEVLQPAAVDYHWLVAGNPSAPPDVLRVLASTRPRLVAGNPSAPPDVLAVLASEMPAEVAGNPQTPSETLVRMAEDETLATQIAERASTPVEVLRALAQHPSDVVKTAIAINPNTPDDALNLIVVSLPGI